MVEIPRPNPEELMKIRPEEHTKAEVEAVDVAKLSPEEQDAQIRENWASMRDAVAHDLVREAKPELDPESADFKDRIEALKVFFDENQEDVVKGTLRAMDYAKAPLLTVAKDQMRELRGSLH